MRILSTAAMRDAEAAAVVAGQSYEQLMENAGTLAAAAIAQRAKTDGLAKTALFLCGAGNNAGDAFVAARVLQQGGWQCSVLPLCGSKYTTLAKRNLLRLPAGVRQLEETADEDFDAAVLVDGVFGIGFHGKLPGNVQAAFRHANAQQNVLRVALDVPSGLAADTGDVAGATFHAHLTLTFGAYKPGLLVFGAKAYTGEVQLLDIGL